MIQLTVQDARRLAITKQHLDGANRPSMLDVIRDIGCLQLDPISHIAPTHQLVLQSRLGAYDQAELDHLRWDSRQLFEYWAHAASIVLTEEFPLHEWQMRRIRKRQGFKNFVKENKLAPLKKRILKQLAEEKAVFSRDIEEETRDPNWDHRWYSARYTPRLLSYMWDRGEVAVVGRNGKQRQWGLFDDFMPEWTPRERWSDTKISHYAIQRSIKALGVATVPQIKKHYTRSRYPKLTAVLPKLLKEKHIQSVTVLKENEPLPGDWYIHTDDIPLLESIQAGNWLPNTALLSPFDNLICDRDRTELLWDFYFRIEIYVPKAKRQFGYYVLPILHGDELIGRIDSKMDRKAGVYQVDNIYAQEGAVAGDEVETAVAQSIQNLGAFLGATQINIGQVPKIWHGLEHKI
ncbi:MAG: crosslink repair DNA glycosylase YcaQ family protein [Chloroflexota bacterium]